MEDVRETGGWEDGGRSVLTVEETPGNLDNNQVINTCSNHDNKKKQQVIANLRVRLFFLSDSSSRTGAAWSGRGHAALGPGHHNAPTHVQSIPQLLKLGINLVDADDAVSHTTVTRFTLMIIGGLKRWVWFRTKAITGRLSSCLWVGTVSPPYLRVLEDRVHIWSLDVDA